VAQLFSLDLKAHMINQKEHFVAWALLITELDDAKEHLESLTKKMVQDGVIDDTEFAVDLGHVYAHLNRVWHSRSQESEITEEQWPIFSQFPKDLKPVG
jgi:hypothetical protein